MCITAWCCWSLLREVNCYIQDVHNGMMLVSMRFVSTQKMCLSAWFMFVSTQRNWQLARRCPLYSTRSFLHSRCAYQQDAGPYPLKFKSAQQALPTGMMSTIYHLKRLHLNVTDTAKHVHHKQLDQTIDIYTSVDVLLVLAFPFSVHHM